MEHDAQSIAADIISQKKPGRRYAANTANSSRMKTDTELLSEISSKLDRVVAVLAAQGKDRATQISILAAAGCDSGFIGTVVGMSAGAVRKQIGWRRWHDDDETADAEGAQQ